MNKDYYSNGQIRWEITDLPQGESIKYYNQDGSLDIEIVKDNKDILDLENQVFEILDKLDLEEEDDRKRENKI